MTNPGYSVAKGALDTINDELNSYDSPPGIAPFGFLSYFDFNAFASIPTFLHVHPFDSPIDPLASSHLPGLSGNIDPPTDYGLAISRIVQIIDDVYHYHR